MTAPRTAAGRELLDDIRDLRTQAEANPEPGVGWWLNEARISVEEELPAIEAEAIEPLLALVRAAEDVIGTGFSIDTAVGALNRLERTYRALPESVRVAARKPE